MTIFTGLTLPQGGACAGVYIRTTMVTTCEHATPCSKKGRQVNIYIHRKWHIQGQADIKFYSICNSFN